MDYLNMKPKKMIHFTHKQEILFQKIPSQFFLRKSDYFQNMSMIQ